MMGSSRSTRRSAGRRRAATRGLSLLELLVGVALLALISSIVMGAVRFGARAWERAEAADRTVGFASAQRAVDARLRAAIPLRSLRSGENPEVFFEGSPNRVTFATVRPMRGASGGLVAIQLSVGPSPSDGGSGDRALLLTRSPLATARPSVDDVPSGETRVLLDDVQGISLRYFGGPELDDAPAWRGDWSPAFQQLPQMVEMSVELAEGDPRRWPVLRVPLAAHRPVDLSELDGGAAYRGEETR